MYAFVKAAVMVKKDWALLARGHGDALDTARRHILNDWDEPLDEDAERFLGTVFERFAPPDLLVWLSRRGPDPRTVPEGAVPTRKIVECFLVKWETYGEWTDRFYLFGREFSPWLISVSAIDPDAWGEIVEAVLPRAAGVFDRLTRAAVIGSLAGCETFRKVCASQGERFVPRGVVIDDQNLRGTLAEALMPIRRDEIACRRALIDRARDRAAEGKLDLLWCLDWLGLLGDVADPREVLPSRVLFPWEVTRDTASPDEQGSPDGEYPIALALRWPSAKQHIAWRWLRERIVALCKRSLSAHGMEAFLFGASGPYRWQSGEYLPLTPLLAEHLKDETRFDDLMRATFDEGVPLPSVRVTLRRDLHAERPDAWRRAFLWCDRAIDELTELLTEGSQTDDASGAAFRRALHARHGVPTDEVEDVTQTVETILYVLMGAPLPSAVDEEFERRLEDTVRRVDALFQKPLLGLWNSLFGGLRRGLFIGWWGRRGELPSLPARRAEILGALASSPELFVTDAAEHVIPRLAPLTEEELPALSAVLRGVYGEARRGVVERYLRLGGDFAARRVVDLLRHTLSARHGCEDGFRLMLVEACRPWMDASLEDALGRMYAESPIEHILKMRAEAHPFAARIDLAAVARERVEVEHERFELLDAMGEFTDILLARFEWLAARTDDARAGSDPAQMSWWAGHRQERVDDEVLALFEKLRAAGVDAERLGRSLGMRAKTCTWQRVVALLGAWERTECPRRSLVEAVCERVTPEGSDDPLYAFATAPACEWLGGRLASRAAWEKNGPDLVRRLFASNRRSLLQVIHGSLEASRVQKDTNKTARLVDAVQMVLAAELADQFSRAMQASQVRFGRKLLRALMDLDAPSRAIQYVLPLRRLNVQDERLLDALDACEHLLRRDTGREPSPKGIWRAFERLQEGDGVRPEEPVNPAP